MLLARRGPRLQTGDDLHAVRVHGGLSDSVCPRSMSEQHAFLDVAKARDFAQARSLIEANPALVNVQPAGRWSVLHQAAAAGDQDMINWLLERGGDVTATTRAGETPKDVAKDAACAALLGRSAGGKKKLDDSAPPPDSKKAKTGSSEDDSKTGASEDEVRLLSGIDGGVTKMSREAAILSSTLADTLDDVAQDAGAPITIQASTDAIAEVASWLEDERSQRARLPCALPKDSLATAFADGRNAADMRKYHASGGNRLLPQCAAADELIEALAKAEGLDLASMAHVTSDMAAPYQHNPREFCLHALRRKQRDEVWARHGTLSRPPHVGESVLLMPSAKRYAGMWGTVLRNDHPSCMCSWSDGPHDPMICNVGDSGSLQVKVYATWSDATVTHRFMQEDAFPLAKPPPSTAEQHAFLDVAKARDFAQARSLIGANPALVNVQPAGRWSVLHQAAAAGDEDMIEWLVRRGANVLVFIDGPEGKQTPMDVAKTYSRWLRNLDEKVSLAAPTAPHPDVLKAASARSGDDEKPSANAPIEEQHAFLDVVRSSDFAQARSLVGANPALVTAQPGGRWSALHHAALAGDPAMVEWLVANGANERAITPCGFTAAELAHAAAAWTPTERIFNAAGDSATVAKTALGDHTGRLVARAARDPDLFAATLGMVDYLGIDALARSLVTSFGAGGDELALVRACMSPTLAFGPQAGALRPYLPNLFCAPPSLICVADEAAALAFLEALCNSSSALTWEQLQLCDGMHLHSPSGRCLGLRSWGAAERGRRDAAVAAAVKINAEAREGKDEDEVEALDSRLWESETELKRAPFSDPCARGHLVSIAVSNRVYRAVQAGDLQAAKNAHREGAEAELFTVDGKNVEQFANYEFSEDHDLEFSEDQINEWGADITKSCNGVTMLMRAAQKDDLPILQWLLESMLGAT